MKRIRRITMEIVQRRQQLTLRPGVVAGPPSPCPVPDGHGPQQPAAPCPVCGGRWLLLDGTRDHVPPVTGESLLQMLDLFPLHTLVCPQGHLWVCRTSLDQLLDPLKEPPK